MAVIVDIDNTILRDGIYPMQSAISKVNSMEDVFLVTGRSSLERTATVNTLRKWHVKYRMLLMNIHGADESSMLRSKRAHAVVIQTTHHVTAAYDDNPMDRTMHKTLGIPAYPTLN